MRCPSCRGDRSSVIDKRNSADMTSHRRRRVCLNPSCKHRWTTIEINVLRSRDALKKELPKEYKRQIINALKDDIKTALDTVFESIELEMDGPRLTRERESDASLD